MLFLVHCKSNYHSRCYIKVKFKSKILHLILMVTIGNCGLIFQLCKLNNYTSLKHYKIQNRGKRFAYFYWKTEVLQCAKLDIGFKQDLKSFLWSPEQQSSL